jgi:hypothetical protein
VFEVTKNLEHNAHAHHRTAHHAITLGCTLFLLQDVQDPPPALLLRAGMCAYVEKVHTAGGIVLCEYLRGAGFPALQWQRTARDADPSKPVKLLAYSFHVYRACAHKPVAAQIVLIGLLGFCCALPALQTVLFATFCVSLLARLSANMYTDLLLEFINNLQQGAKRSASAASFGRALDLTTLLPVLLHVRHAFQATELGAAASDDPITPSMLVQARLVQDELCRVLGTDLTVVTNLNPFHRAGGVTVAEILGRASGGGRDRAGVALDGGDARTHRPWIFWGRVAEGRSAGFGRSRIERWQTHVERYIFTQCFPF